MGQGFHDRSSLSDFPLCQGKSLKERWAGRIFCSEQEKALWIFMCQNVIGLCRESTGSCSALRTRNPGRGGVFKDFLSKNQRNKPETPNLWGVGLGGRGECSQEAQSLLLGQVLSCWHKLWKGHDCCDFRAQENGQDTCRSSPFNGDQIQDVLGSLRGLIPGN